MDPIPRALLVALLITVPADALAVAVERFAVPMSDGARLNTDVYHPINTPAPYPALLIRTPYGIDEGGVQSLTQYGFAVVFQDVRGRFGSEGEFRLFRDDGWGPDHADGVDTVTWILEQPWCSGSIVTSGSEAIGLTQNLLAAASPPALRAQVIASAPTTFVEDFVYPGGAFRLGDVSGFLARLNAPSLLDTLLAHPPHDPWWTWTDAGSRIAMSAVPTYRISGWYDPNLAGTLRAYDAVDATGTPQKLVIGPWTTRVGDPVVGDRVFDVASIGDAEILVGSSWEWLMALGLNIHSGIFEKRPIAYYVMGSDEPGAPGNAWRSADRWPPDARALALYAHPGGGLSSAPPSDDRAVRTYTYDPLDPVSTLGGANLIGATGTADQRPVESRDDVLVFTSNPLDGPLTVAGAVSLTLYASSDAPDTDFTAKLSDVYPDGRSMLVCDGIVRASQRNGRSNEPLTAGEVTRYDIDLGATAVAFASGHRIRLAVSSSNYPRFHPNPNTGDAFSRGGTVRVARNAVHMSDAYPTALTLPVVGGAKGTGDAPVATTALHPVPPPPATVRVRRGPGGPVRVHITLRRSGDLSVRVVDAEGRSVRTLASGRERRGELELRWDGRHQSGREAAPGAYRVELTVDGVTTPHPFMWSP